MSYEFSPEHNAFLSSVSAKLVRTAPRLMRDYLVRTAVDDGRREAEIWFKTAGCRFFLRGGCTMCNYGHSQKVQVETMVAGVRAALAEAEVGQEDKLLVTPSGSMFDRVEVPIEAYRGIMALVRDRASHSFKTEAQAHYITPDAVRLHRELIGDDRKALIVCGLESANPWLRRNCLNKDLPTGTFLSALATAHAHGLGFSTNVLLGVPLLTAAEAIEDAVDSLRWVLGHGVDEAYLFPVHVKPGTVTHWFWEHGQFSPPSLWSLVEVLSRFSAEELRRISVAWHKAYYVPAADADAKRHRIPFSCPDCYQRVVGLLDAFVATRSPEPVAKLGGLTCACRDVWRRELEAEAAAITPPLTDRVRAGFRAMATEVLGPGWLDREGHVLDATLATRATDRL